jgi:hypothetical protein
MCRRPDALQSNADARSFPEPTQCTMYPAMPLCCGVWDEQTKGGQTMLTHKALFLRRSSK